MVTYKYLLILLYLLSYQAQAKCNLKWGAGDLQTKNNGCHFTSDKSGSPSYILTAINEWDVNQNIYITLNVKNTAALQGIRIDFLKGSELVSSYDIPRFTDPEFNIIQENSSIRFSIPSSQLKNINNSKINNLGIYLIASKDQVVTFQITDITQTVKTSPGRISITFDDGHSSNIKAAKLMKQYKMKATSYIIPNAVTKKGYLDWNNIKELKKMGWSISTHMTTPLTRIDIKTLEKTLQRNKKKLELKTGNKETSQHFAVPLGKHNIEVINVLKKVFKSNRLAAGGIESLPPADLYRLKTINVLETTSPEELFKLARNAIAHKEWAIFMFHYLDQPEKKELNYSTDNYKKFIKLIAPLNKNIKTVNEVISEI